MEELGYQTAGDDNAKLCTIWKETEYRYNKTWYNNTLYETLHTYKDHLEGYFHDALKPYSWASQHGLSDIRRYLSPTNHDVCDYLQVMPDLVEQGTPGVSMASISSTSPQRYLRQRHTDSNSADPNTTTPSWTEKLFHSDFLSYTTHHGWMEPLIPPLRHPALCYHLQGDIESLDALNLDFLILDFPHMCRRLKPDSKIIVLDLGASPQFMEKEHTLLHILRQLQQFGFHVDHWYAWEHRHTELVPAESVQHVYERIPPQWRPALHWINAPPHTEQPGHPLNPWTVVQQAATPDDLVLVKMDMGPSNIEWTLAEQLRETPALWELVDHFFWEHKVHVHELSRHWGGQMMGTAAESLQFMADLRRRGIAAHYWV